VSSGDEGPDWAGNGAVTGAGAVAGAGAAVGAGLGVSRCHGHCIAEAFTSGIKIDNDVATMIFPARIFFIRDD